MGSLAGIYLFAVLSLRIAVLAVLVVAGGAAWLLAKSLFARGAGSVGIFSMAMGIVGVVLSLVSLIDYSGTREMHGAALIASAVIFGSGAVATAIAKSR